MKLPGVEKGIPVPINWKNDGRRHSHHRNPSAETLSILQFLRVREVGESFIVHNSEAERYYTLARRAGRTTVRWRHGRFEDHLTRIWVVE